MARDVGSASPEGRLAQDGKADRRETRIKFRKVVEVLEHARLLGGGCGVPSDGSVVALGLGELIKECKDPLWFADDDAPMAEAAFVPLEQRIKLLKAAMGEASFYKEKKAHTKEANLLKKERELSAYSQEDWEQMPRGLEEALERAQALATEMAGDFQSRPPRPTRQAPKVEAEEVQDTPQTREVRGRGRWTRTPQSAAVEDTKEDGRDRPAQDTPQPSAENRPEKLKNARRREKQRVVQEPPEALTPVRTVHMSIDDHDEMTQGLNLNRIWAPRGGHPNRGRDEVILLPRSSTARQEKYDPGRSPKESTFPCGGLERESAYPLRPTKGDKKVELLPNTRTKAPVARKEPCADQRVELVVLGGTASDGQPWRPTLRHKLREAS